MFFVTIFDKELTPVNKYGLGLREETRLGDEESFILPTTKNIYYNFDY